MRFLSFFLFAGLMALLSSSTVQASPDVDFPQEGRSYGGKVRSGPGMQYQQSGSLSENEGVLILNGTGVMMNGYEWFQIRYRGNRTGYQWGGLMCSNNYYPTMYQTCAGGGPQVSAPTSPPTSAPVPSGANGYNVIQVFHPGGSFLVAGNGQWDEVDSQGQVTFSFQEQARDEWSVYLFDASRNVSLQLDLYRREILYGLGNAPKTRLYGIIDAFAGGNRQFGGAAPQPAGGGPTTVYYNCAEGLPLYVTYDNSGNGHVIFTIDGSPRTRLDQVVSGSGSRYTNGMYTLYSKGNTAIIEGPSGQDVCQAQQ